MAGTPGTFTGKKQARRKSPRLREPAANSAWPHGSLTAVFRRCWLCAVGLLAGCPAPLAIGVYGPQPAYGVTPPPHDPTVQITDFSYTPSSPIHRGDTLTFTAKLSRPAPGNALEVVLGDPARNFAALRDDGLAPDDHANDGVYRGTAVWKYSFGLAQDEPVKVQMTWYDGYPGGELAGAPLTVEE